MAPHPIISFLSKYYNLNSLSSLMESLSICLSASQSLPNHRKTLKFTSKSNIGPSNSLPTCNSTSNFTSQSFNSLQICSSNHQLKSTSRTKFFNLLFKNLSFLNTQQLFLKPNMGVLFLGLSFPLSCFASETIAASEEVSSKINLEAILVSIDNFFNRYPFFVATVTFIWLVVIPLTEEYLQKYKFISAINAFKKLQDDPNSQLLDIRDSRSLAYLESPNLKILNKSALQVEFREGVEEGFVKKVLKNFGEPENTTICIIDNFDGNSMKAAELLVKNGIKEAYAIRGGIRGKKGWQVHIINFLGSILQEIQETLLPPSVCVYPKKKVKLSKELNPNGGVQQQDYNSNHFSSTTSSGNSKEDDNYDRDVDSINPTLQSKGVPRPSSPYPNYPDLKPPSSPTPSKPKN